MSDLVNPLRRLWAQGRPALNGWIALPGAFSAEIMAGAGWDALTVDLQHGTAAQADLAAILPPIQASGAAPLARVTWNDPGQVMRALDAGALGVICPMIETVADAESFVSACLYPPRGRRSFGPIRARIAWDGYPEAANDAVLPIAMIETRAALDNLEDILAVEELGAVYIGPADLGSALGFPPKMDRREPELVEAIGAILAAAKARGVPACIHCGTAEYAAEMTAKGFSMVTVGSDARFVEASAAATVAETRAAIAKAKGQG